jgi:hypothetical protein
MVEFRLAQVVMVAGGRVLRPQPRRQPGRDVAEDIRRPEGAGMGDWRVEPGGGVPDRRPAGLVPRRSGPRRQAFARVVRAPRLYHGRAAGHV